MGDLTSPSDAERGQSLIKRCPQREITTVITAETLQRAFDGGAATRAILTSSSKHLPLRERPLLTADEMKRLLAQLDPSYLESELVALLTPTLLQVVQQLPDSEQVLVNSESLKWLHTASGDKAHYQKPDLFVCHRSAFLAGATPAGTGAASLRAAQIRRDSAVDSAAYLFGRCAWPLREAMECLIEAKRKQMSLNEAVGECFAKAQNLLRGSQRASRKVVLFDAQDVRLLVFTSSGLLSLQTFQWTAPGSFLVLLDFLHAPANTEPDWLSVLRSACAHFQMILAPSGAFLGQGATGRVFRVRRSDRDDGEEEVKSAGPDDAPHSFALKVVEGSQHGEHITSLQREVEQLTRLLLTLPEDHSVRRYLPHSCSSLHTSYDRDGREPVGAAALFEPVGLPLSEAERTEALWTEVCRALAALHAAGLRHGDPRLPNIIRMPACKPGHRTGATARRASPGASTAAAVASSPPAAALSSANGQLVWIDLRTSSLKVSEAEVRLDCDMLLRSFFRAEKDDPRLIALVAEYLPLVRGEEVAAAVLERWSWNAWEQLGGAISAIAAR